MKPEEKNIQYNKTNNIINAPDNRQIVGSSYSSMSVPNVNFSQIHAIHMQSDILVFSHTFDYFLVMLFTYYSDFF